MQVLKVTCPLITSKTAGFSYKQRNVPNVTGVTRCYKVLQIVTMSVMLQLLQNTRER